MSLKMRIVKMKMELPLMISYKQGEFLCLCLFNIGDIMPYGEVYRKGKEYCFKNKRTKKERCFETKENSQKQLNLLRAIEYGFVPSKVKK